jgi:transcriptional regulator with XRE-family HTH domain
MERTSVSKAELKRLMAGLTRRIAEVVDGDSDRDVAVRVGFSRETVRRARSGWHVRAEFLMALCRAYDVPPDWLLLGDLPTGRSVRGELGAALERAEQALADAKKALREAGD